MNSSPFAFFEVVVIESSRPELRDVTGKHAVVLGMAEEAGHWSYSVLIEPRGTCWSVDETDIKGTGEVRRREEFYDGSAIRVSRDVQMLE